jgi:hypothetical protein
MSDTGGPPILPPHEGPPPERSGCLTAVMVLSGIVLLLPGLCAVIFGSQGGSSAIMPLVAIGLIVGLCGVVLIGAAIARLRR